jgi:hypothetical protein
MTIAILPLRPRRRREKIFGQGRGVPLDRNAKARIMVYARAWSVRHRRPGQHRGPLTRATLEVLHALLWGFHNSRDGRCFPSYETIAQRVQCCRDTVYEAIKALEGGRHSELGEPADPGAVPRARSVRADGAALAPGPHQQCLCVPGSDAVRAGRPAGAQTCGFL